MPRSDSSAGSVAAHPCSRLAGLLLRLTWSLFLMQVDVWAETNPVQRENARPGTTEWRLTNPALHREIEGYASLTSVNRGHPIKFYVHTQDRFYRLEIYRMGWYGGAGARLVHGPVTLRGISQPMPSMDPQTGLVECAWQDSYLLVAGNGTDQEEWVSGIYLAKLTAGISGAQAYIIFVVRDETRPSDFLFQSSVTTYQAYNNWGGKSLYDFNSAGGRRAYKVSFNRPYAISSNAAAAYGNGAGDFLTNNAVPPTDASSPSGWEYNMVRWLEREGYDVTYSTSIDTHADARLLDRHKGWLSVGHDEYWTWQMRAHVEGGRDRGVHLAFFSGNVCYWQIRLEPSTITGELDRTMVSYKDDAATRDPFARAESGKRHLMTVRWRDEPVNRPEESLIGVMYDGNPVDADIVVTKPDHWTMTGTELRPGDRLPRLLGYEADRVFGSGPPGTTVLAESPYTFEGRRHLAHMTIYAHHNGAIVFAAGTIQWSWGLDDFNVPNLRKSSLNPSVRQITKNVLARFRQGASPHSE
ncbi:MAG TPA: N,N-dimethylformamidase beta subunit family domain-containing protein [Nitrospiraceae bacterium]|nr:N,N-dimethylformamidase beta subunit family domain-containing protein [Nitrospiraceae bacterium]